MNGNVLTYEYTEIFIVYKLNKKLPTVFRVSIRPARTLARGPTRRRRRGRRSRRW
jgi:hypothetical protein